MTAGAFHGLRSVSPRQEDVRVIVLHWTGGARVPEGVVDTLRHTVGRHTPDGLSVHEITGADGSMLHGADYGLEALHAGVANPFSIGNEVCSPGYPRTAAHRAEIKRGVRRAEYVDYIRGIRVRMVDYTEAQYATLLPWIDRVCEEYGIPKVVPLDSWGDLLQRQMTPEELAVYRGVMGHFHCHPKKNDPGTAPFLRLMKHWGLSNV